MQYSQWHECKKIQPEVNEKTKNSTCYFIGMAHLKSVEMQIHFGVDTILSQIRMIADTFTDSMYWQLCN